MKIAYDNIVEIRPAETNIELTEIILVNGCSIFIRNNENQFCISLNVENDKTELWIEQ